MLQVVAMIATAAAVMSIVAEVSPTAETVDVLEVTVMLPHETHTVEVETKTTVLTIGPPVVDFVR